MLLQTSYKYLCYDPETDRCEYIEGGLTKSLTEQDAISIYDPQKLSQIAPNEYKFLSCQKEALLLITTVKPDPNEIITFHSGA